MNPIFTRRNRPVSSTASHSRSSNSTNSQQQGSGRTTPVDEPYDYQSQADNPAAISPSLSPTEPDRGSYRGHHGVPSSNRSIGQQRKENRNSAGAAHNVDFVENLLAVKQNMLAQVSLTPEENLLRQRRKQIPPTSSSSSSTDSSPEDGTLKKTDNNKLPDSKSHGSNEMVLCDIEDDEFAFESNNDIVKDPQQQLGISSSNNNNGNRHLDLLDIRKPLIDGRPVVKTMDAQTWRDLRNVVTGPNCVLQDGWLGQGFTFDQNIVYGLVQKRGGPCGVLAVVQALVLRNLLFGSPISDDEELPISDPLLIFSQDPGALRMLTFRRVRALVCAITEILWRCANSGSYKGCCSTDSSSGGGSGGGGSSGSTWQDFRTVAREMEGHPAVVCFSGASVGAELRIFDREIHLKNFVYGNLQKFDCVSLVYSAVLSRGVEQVQEDFDFPNCPLLGSHGYCSQELVNLLATGKAISNVFDNQISLDDKVLKGMESRSDIGLLSLFEHYDSCQVGNYLKSPKFPIWIVCSESHFSVLFATDAEVANDGTLDKFDLYYYDGLARQHNHIRLAIELVQVPASHPYSPHHHHHRIRIQAGSSASSFNNNSNSNNNNGSDGDEDLVPPLEKCIRTKWKGARVDWNETEPIL